MLGWTDLKAEMASCWKVGWNVDPLALSVPLRLAELLDEPPAGAEEPEPPLGEELLLPTRSMRRGPAPRRRRKPPPRDLLSVSKLHIQYPSIFFSGRYERSLGRPVIR